MSFSKFTMICRLATTTALLSLAACAYSPPQTGENDFSKKSREEVEKEYSIALKAGQIKTAEPRIEPDTPREQPKSEYWRQIQKEARQDRENWKRRSNEGVLIYDRYGNVRNPRNDCLAAQRRTGVLTAYCTANGWSIWRRN
jgi:hypothetical protein